MGNPLFILPLVQWHASNIIPSYDSNSCHQLKDNDSTILYSSPYGTPLNHFINHNSPFPLLKTPIKHFPRNTKTIYLADMQFHWDYWGSRNSSFCCCYHTCDRLQRVLQQEQQQRSTWRGTRRIHHPSLTCCPFHTLDTINKKWLGQLLAINHFEWGIHTAGASLALGTKVLVVMPIISWLSTRMCQKIPIKEIKNTLPPYLLLDQCVQ